MINHILAQYKNLAKLGQGGMGVVYRAEDTKLGRQVAIKVLPEAFAADPERMARFKREAELPASPDHRDRLLHCYNREKPHRAWLISRKTRRARKSNSPTRGGIDHAIHVCMQLHARKPEPGNQAPP